MIEKILAIQNCGPSGTTLLQSLLDGHPDIITLPGLHAQQLLVFWSKYQHLQREALFTQFTLEFYTYYEPNAVPNDLGLRELGEHRNQLAIVDKSLFLDGLRKRWEGQEHISSKTFVTSVFLAYHEAIGRQIKPDAYILYPIHSLKKEYAALLIQDFKCVRFLHTVREPLQSIGSAAKHINKYEHWDHHYLLACISAQMISDFTLHVGPHVVHGMQPYFKDTPDGRVQSRALKLEDIHANPQASLLKICHWLGIAWNDCLLLSTFNGLSWHNRPESIRQSGTGQQVLQQKHTDILPPFDRYRFELLSTSFKSHFGYGHTQITLTLAKKLQLSLLMLVPFRMELLRDRWKRQLGQFRDKKIKRRLTKYIPDAFDKPIIITRNLVKYIECRLKWLLPPIFQSSTANTINYVEKL